MITYFGITAGQMSVAVGTFLGPTLFTITGIIFCLALLPVSLSTRSTPAPPASVRLDLGAIWRNSPVAAIACFLAGIAMAAWNTWSGLWQPEWHVLGRCRSNDERRSIGRRFGPDSLRQDF